jgi:hypothetical protein
VKLPPDYPKLTCSNRTPLASALVNDIWVSVTSGSEDYSFKVHCPFLPLVLHSLAGRVHRMRKHLRALCPWWSWLSLKLAEQVAVTCASDDTFYPKAGIMHVGI